MPKSFTNLLSHIIFSTKNREPWINTDLAERLFPFMGGVVREIGGKAIIVNGPADHVHLLVSLPPTRALADALRVIKSNASRWVHENWRSLAGFGWQAGYGAFSVSESSRDEVIKYIASQQEHHRKISFQEEFLAFLNRHAVKYDPRYIWE